MKQFAFLSLILLLTACTPATQTEPPLAVPTPTAVPPTLTPEIYVAIESSYALELREEMIKTADAIFAGQVTDISPTRFNQGSGEYWDGTTKEGAGLETTHTALPVFTIELTVDEGWVDEVGLGETAVLTQVGSSPLDDNSDWPIQVGDEIIAFVVQREIAWWNSQPPGQETLADGTITYELGRREVLRFSNAPSDTYLLRQDDGRYASLPDADEPWPPLMLDEFSHEIALFRPVKTNDSVRLPVTTPELGPATAVPSNQSAIQIGAPILFIRDNDLWRADINGQNEQRLTEGEILADWGIDKLPAYDPWWAGGFPPHIHVSPDGRWLAFTQNGSNLVLVDVTGAQPPRFHDLEGWAMIFTWSPDSQSLAYSIQPHFLADNKRSGIFVYDVVVDEPRHLLNQNGGDLAWSPDGRFLAFSCCFSEPQAGLYEGTYKGEVRQVELATGNVTSVGETWIGVASGPPPTCWSAEGAVGIDVAEPVTCSYGRPYPHGISPDGTQQAYLALRSPDDEEYFHLLAVKNVAADKPIWQREVPLVQKVYWSPDGQHLLLGSDYFAPETTIWRIPADGRIEAEIVLSDALLLDVIAVW